MKLYKIGQSINWYKATWDGTLNPIVFAACKGWAREKKNFGRGRKLAVMLIKKNNFWLGYDIDDLNHVGNYMVKLWNKNHLTFNHHKKNYLKSLLTLKRNYQKIPRKLTNLSDIELIKLYSSFFDLYVEFMGWSVFCEPVIIHLQPFVDRILNKCLKNFPEKSCHALIMPSWRSFLGKKELIELKISFKISQNKKLKQIFTKNTKAILDYLSKPLKNNRIILKSLEHLEKNYYWIQNNYVRAKYLSLDFFVAEIKDLLKKNNFSPRKIKIRINKLRDPKQLRKKAYKKTKPNSKDKFYLNLLDKIGFLQDARKGIYIESIEYFDRLFKEISRRIHIKESILKFLYPEELNQVFIVKKQKKLKSLARKRYNQCAVIFRDGKIAIETNRQKLLKIKKWLTPKLEKVKEFKGTPVSIGPKVRGFCRVLLSTSEIYKVKHGDILVTGSTAPDYLPAMKKAAAILTEKGGLTSHAAIVSRELGIPCIVGILNLLNLLKDGNSVEVDANKGIVRILKK